MSNKSIHSTGLLEITRVAPGLFTAEATGKGLAAALVLRVKSNGQQIYEPVAAFDAATQRMIALPIDLRDSTEEVFLLLFGTGIRHRVSLADVAVTIGGLNAETLYAGSQGSFAGLDQVNVRLSPALAGRGETEVGLVVEGRMANPVTIFIR